VYPYDDAVTQWDRPVQVPVEAVATVVQRASSSGFFFDFDGTLAPIQDDPNTVQAVPGAASALVQLARRIRRVGIVSARPVAFLRQHFPDPAITLFGLYGLERSTDDGDTAVDPAAQRWLPAVQELVGRAGLELPASTLVEDKRLSVALHYRLAPSLEQEILDWARVRAAEYQLRLQQGRMVVELLPPLDVNKGLVISREIAELTCAWYFGDDIGDIPAYQALTNRAAQDEAFAMLRVAVSNPETGQALNDLVDLVLSSQRALVALLREVLGVLQGSYSMEDRSEN
jgi:trehalose 6-phosphate phosphatase